ncbi:DUF6344 domain-containing protein [Streptomyces sp. NBC_01788]|uniref:DUF6344 domain-containing protein n=1 Tax=Streptomyces sp. NBC_01788 TaxID=2975940 RepID=UPI002DDADAFB|nr:DUF6344 domain-containing protein [Streptomyces sp. NBC_01788]WSB27694.1 DUF6344 domain-containing protein [Streptomyces sp. NBC_01788]
MDQHKVMKLWTAIVTAFLALCTALGLITTTAASAAAVAPQPETAPKSTAPVPAQTTPPLSKPQTPSLPPTMKQRIRAEAHGRTPGCRHRPPVDAFSLAAEPRCLPDEPPARPAIPLQR